jgi:hypothetical protein
MVFILSRNDKGLCYALCHTIIHYLVITYLDCEIFFICRTRAGPANFLCLI